MTDSADKIFNTAENVAKSYADMVQAVSQALLDATAQQQKTQHDQMVETAKLCARILKKS